jgi:hypothetical protein
LGTRKVRSDDLGVSCLLWCLRRFSLLYRLVKDSTKLDQYDTGQVYGDDNLGTFDQGYQSGFMEGVAKSGFGQCPPGQGC